MTFDNLIESSTFPLWHTAHNSKTCLVQHLCNPFHCVMQPWFSFPFYHFQCIFNYVIRHPVYYETKFLSQCMSECPDFTVFCPWPTSKMIPPFPPSPTDTPEGYSLILQPLSWAEQANSRWPAEPRGTFQWWPHLASQLYACAEYSSCLWKKKIETLFSLPQNNFVCSHTNTPWSDDLMLIALGDIYIILTWRIYLI